MFIANMFSLLYTLFEHKGDDTQVCIGVYRFHDIPVCQVADPLQEVEP